VDEVLINANRSQARYRQLAPVIGDAQADFQGRWPACWRG
jgi:molybdopterin-guanine dinucleotide biosynthesis protein A